MPTHAPKRRNAPADGQRTHWTARGAAGGLRALIAADGPGQPLAPDTRHRMEIAFGQELGHVRLSKGTAPGALDAQAAAVGPRILMPSVGFDITSQRGQHLLAHELAHTLQRPNAQINDSRLDTAPIDPAPTLEAQADAAAGQALAGTTPSLVAQAHTAPAVLRMQRKKTGKASKDEEEDDDSDDGEAMQMDQPHSRPPLPSEAGRHFMITHRPGTSASVGQYVGPGAQAGTHVFQTSRGPVTLPAAQVHGLRPTHGGIHPPGQVRPPEQNLGGRSNVMLSVGNASEPVAKLASDPSSSSSMAVTMFEERADDAETQGNVQELQGQGIPVLGGMDLSNEEHVQRLSGTPDDTNFHFQMPRVPRGVPGYSTQKLVADTASIPETLGKPDATVSVTTPHPNSYKGKGVYQRIYGLRKDQRNAFLAGKGTGMEDDGSEDDELMGNPLYKHVQTTNNYTTGAAEKRTRIRLKRKTKEKKNKRRKSSFQSPKTEHEDNHDQGGTGGKGPPPPPPGGGTMIPTY